MNKQTINGILAILSVFVLIIPIALNSYVEAETIDNIISVQGSYGIGTQFEIYSGNVSENFETLFPITSTDNPLGYDSDNDSVLYGYMDEGVFSERDGQYYGNYLTYTGNGTYLANINGSNLPPSTYDAFRRYYIPYNINAGELAEFDFVRIHTDINQTNINQIGLIIATGIYSTHSLYGQAIDSDTEIITISQTYKDIFNNNPNGSVWIVFSGNDEAFISESETFSVSVEANTLNPSDYLLGFEYSDFTIWIILIMAMDVFYLFVVIFANPVIDINFDKKKSKWRR